MKQLIFPKRPLPGYVAQHVQPAIELAYGFLCAKYGWLFDDVILLFMTTRARCSFYCDNAKIPHGRFGHTPVASIHPTSKMYLYEKNSLGKFKKGVDVGYLVGTATAIVHELTHHVQFKRGPRKVTKQLGGGLRVEYENNKPTYSELETTANELEFMKLCFPEEYKRVVVEERQVKIQNLNGGRYYHPNVGWSVTPCLMERSTAELILNQLVAELGKTVKIVL